MKIAISMFAGDGGKSGISQYMKQILDAMLVLSDEHQFTLFMTHSDRTFFDPQHPRVRVVSYPDLFGHPIISIFWHLIWLPVALLKHGSDLVFLPAANRRLGFWYPVPSIGTVHDFSQLHVPAKYDRARMFYIMHLLPGLMRRLTRVISISHSTTRDLVEFARVAPQKIDLIYNGANLDRYQPTDKSAAYQQVKSMLKLSGEPYLLYVSRIEHPGKNHVQLLNAFAQLRSTQNLPHKLVFVGSRWSGAEVVDETIRSLGLSEQVILPGFVPDDKLPALYAGAELLVFPSLFEGFGIPLLEAMASGTPVCTSNCSSMPEVVGDAGRLFDPRDPSDIARVMAEVLGSPELYAELRQRGISRARQFSWKKSATELLESCSSIITTGR